jgi:hypothetical protein
MNEYLEYHKRNYDMGEYVYDPLTNKLKRKRPVHTTTHYYEIVGTKNQRKRKRKKL